MCPNTDRSSLYDNHAQTTSRHPDAIYSTAPYEPAPYTLSIVVPTRNEASNVAGLVRRLEQALPERRIEIIFVDDSDDETVMAIQAIRTGSRCEIRLIHRPPEQRVDGLGGAVILGLRAARAPWVCVMDADLQHPPELVPHLFQRAETGQRDIKRR
jgi:glycosyltransferase involved in cell wall biosynthesis